MGRPRKNQAKPPPKQPSKQFVAVRKSTRQIARKQQTTGDFERHNGDIAQPVDDTEDNSRGKDDSEKSTLKKVGAPKKVRKRKEKTSEDARLLVETENSVKRSEEREVIEERIDLSKKLTAEDVRQMVVGDAGESTMEGSADQQVLWSEDVIEETIICEEMEVEGDVSTMESSRYTLADDGSVVLEEVLLVNEPRFDGKNVVEFTVIRNEDGTESMVESMLVSDSNSIGNHYEETGSEFRLIEKGVSCLRVNEMPVEEIKAATEPEKSEFRSNSLTDDNRNAEQVVGVKDKRDNIYNSDDSGEIKSASGRKKSVKREKKKVKIPNNLIKNVESPEPPSSKENNSTDTTTNAEENGSLKATKLGIIEESSNSSELDKQTITRMAIGETGETSTPIVDNQLAKIDGVDDLGSTRIDDDEKSIVEPADVEDTSSEYPRAKGNRGKLQRSSQDDEDSTTTSDKSESRSEDQTIKGKSESRRNRKEPTRTETSKGNRSNPINAGKSLPQPPDTPGPDKTAGTDRNIEELSRDCEFDVKVDSEDVKSLTSSGSSGNSSENSNDTSVSLTNCKLPELTDGKISTGTNEAEKKVGFRSRSGSTDTTGSESGSNSSAVRRSSRIRTIGLMKQRSRGRGLVTKPNLDMSKLVVLQQERDRLANSGTPSIQESRDTPDSQSDTQSDRAGKIAMSTDSQIFSNPSSGIAGYDSDSSKPVKVKSRWRRSSELEMGGSRLAFTNITAPGSAIGSDFGTSSGSSSAAVTPVPTDSESPKDATLSNVPTTIPRTVGARIPLPMVLEVKDREMEERLSQFEHLKENAYLTERYTNKETKRMLCDCFLTEDEIERGELGCGEDCLNRLLMIECGSRCVVGDRCTNKRFQNCEYAKCEVFRTEKKGFGLRATADLEGGEFIMEYVGEVLNPKDFRRRAKDYSKDKNRHYYFMALKSDQIIDATMKGNISRFINHSCDPNAETQKWTVNGELRIGFFNRRFVAAGEEITFDYHFQRYGKEAQKCYCEAPNCRGWIGETPEEEQEKIEKKEKREKDPKKTKKEEKKPIDYMEDEDLEEEIDKLCQCGLKNRAHTLNLSRLMVRSREIEHRTRLLRVIQAGEQPCRRLFLDYHGLRLIWSYMMDLAGNQSEEAQQFRLDIVKTLSTLPIPNKTMLMDSKVYSVVQKWSEERYLSPQRESPDDEQATRIKSEDNEASCDQPSEKPNNEQSKESGSAEDKEAPACDQIKQEPTDLVPELATNLLNQWDSLKEVFRIPKKERIEQMKEHEREADRGYREDLEKDDRRDTWYDRSRPDRYSRGDNDKRIDRRRSGRESPDSESYRSKDKRLSDERSNLVPVPRLSKFERRQLFALKVAKEEEERLRRQQQESWQEHEARCLALGIDPHTTATVDPQTGYPLFFNPALGQWQPYPPQEGEIAAQCTPMYGTPGLTTEISPVMSQQTVYAPGFPPSAAVTYPGLPHHQQYPDPNLVANGTPPLPPGQQLFVEQTPEAQLEESVVEAPDEAPPPVPPIDLPPKWKCAKDARGRLYYYHVKERISQWLPPPPDHIGVQPDSSSSSESSEESSSSEDDDQDEDRGTEQPPDEDMDCTAANSAENSVGKHPSTNKLDPRGIVGSTVLISEPKKPCRRDGLVQERIISPRREEDRTDHKKYKDIKEKMRRQKERARMKEHVDKMRKHRRTNKSKNHSRHLNKVQDPTSDITAAAERKIKDTFRISMANVMVHFLNPYRKNDCKQGRITNTEDFKHLARKLTHFVLAKELKHCKSVDELQCNENVKHKAKDFVRKYMNKFGEVYHKSDED